MVATIEPRVSRRPPTGPVGGTAGLRSRWAAGCWRPVSSSAATWGGRCPRWVALAVLGSIAAVHSPEQRQEPAGTIAARNA